MTSRIALVTAIAATLSAGALMAKQETALHNGRAGVVDRMSTALNLTDQQKQQAKDIFTAERESARSVRLQLREERKAVYSAIHAGKPPAEVQQLAKNEAPALGELAGMRAAAFDKFYGILTPDQQQKLASLHQQWRQKHAAAAPAR